MQQQQQSSHHHQLSSSSHHTKPWFLLMLSFLTIFPLFAPSGSVVTCHGPLHGIQYRYNYVTKLLLNSDTGGGGDGGEPAGFGVQVDLNYENVWQDLHSYLTVLTFNSIHFTSRSGDIGGGVSTKESPQQWPPVLVQHDAAHGTIKSLYVAKKHVGHSSGHQLEPTHMNLIVSLLNSLRTRFEPDQAIKTDRILTRFSSSKSSPESASSSSILSPTVIDSWQIVTKLTNDHDIAEHVEGEQNVTIASKFYPQSHSSLVAKFLLTLRSEHPSTIAPLLSSAKSVTDAIREYGVQVAQHDTMIPLVVHFIAERAPCAPHYCGRLEDMITAYHQQLSSEHSLATTSIGVAYLKLFNHLRTNSATITRKDVVRLLKHYFKRRHQDGDVFITLLDVIAGVRNGEAMMGALQFLELPSCGESSAEICERFLVAISITGITVANMGDSYVAEHSLSSQQMMDLFLPLSTSTKWSDERVQHSYALTLATLLHSYQMQLNAANEGDDGGDVDEQHLFGQSRSSSSSNISAHRLYADTLIAPHTSPLYVDVSESLSSGGDAVGGDQTNQMNHHHTEKLGATPHLSRKRFNKVAEKVLKYLIHELDTNCKTTDCRVVYLHALGNARIVAKHGVLNVFKRYALNSGKRESVAALKALRDCMRSIHFDGGDSSSSAMKINEESAKLQRRLRQLLIRIVYDGSVETTARLIAAEVLATKLDHNGVIIDQLSHHLDLFPTELATMIWKRAVLISRDRRRLHRQKQRDQQQSSSCTATTNWNDPHKNWHLKSHILNGSSDSFDYIMGSTAHCNISYNVVLELLKGKLPKETSFGVNIGKLLSDMFNDETTTAAATITQDVFNVGLFARGLQSFAGGDTDDADDEMEDNEITAEDDDATLAGMTLQVLGNQIRPFLFFRSTSELMGHLWSGAASEPTPVFRANLLVADYLDIRPLINGLLVEQSLKGMISVHLSGEVQVSLWNRNSHSNVQTQGAVLFQGAQEVYTTDRRTSARKYFSFGTESRLDFITDFDFYNTPYRICIQLTQPEFIFRHNTRKYEQVHSDNLHRRIHRRSYRIPAKSYILNHDNSKMCALMNADE